MFVLTPAGPLAINVTGYVPAAYVWTTELVVTLVVLLSPKSQNQLLIVPVELSLNVTSSGAVPLVGLPMKSATGGFTKFVQQNASWMDTESTYHPLPTVLPPLVTLPCTFRLSTRHVPPAAPA